MLVGRDVTHVEDVRRPGKLRRVLRPAEHEPAFGQPPRRLEEQPLDAVLAIVRVGAEYDRSARNIFDGRDRLMDAPDRRCRTAARARRAEPLAQPVAAIAAGVAEHEIVAGQARAAPM